MGGALTSDGRAGRPRVGLKGTGTGCIGLRGSELNGSVGTLRGDMPVGSFSIMLVGRRR